MWSLNLFCYFTFVQNTVSIKATLLKRSIDLIIRAQAPSPSPNWPMVLLHLNEQYNIRGRNSCKIADLLGLETFDLLRTYELAPCLFILPEPCKRAVLELDSHPVRAVPAKTVSHQPLWPRGLSSCLHSDSQTCLIPSSVCRLYSDFCFINKNQINK